LIAEKHWVVMTVLPIELQNDNFWSWMSYCTFTVGTFSHPTLYILNMQVDMFMGEWEVCAVLQHNIVGSTHCYTTCPPCATPIGSFHDALPLATFCGLPLGSYREVSALCERIVSVYHLNLL
jgi:hypothetical protein